MWANYSKIDILIGSDIYMKILMGLVKQLKGGLIAVCTKFDWAVCSTWDDFSTVKEQGATTLSTNLLSGIAKFPIFGKIKGKIFRKNRNIGYLTKFDYWGKNGFLNSLTQNEESHYCVGLPWL